MMLIDIAVYGGRALGKHGGLYPDDPSHSSSPVPPRAPYIRGQLAVGRALGCGWCEGTHLLRTVRVLEHTVPAITNTSTYARARM